MTAVPNGIPKSLDTGGFTSLLQDDRRRGTILICFRTPDDDPAVWGGRMKCTCLLGKDDAYDFGALYYENGNTPEYNRRYINENIDAQGFSLLYFYIIIHKERV